MLFARLLSGYGRDAALNVQERKAPGTVSITQLPGSPSCRGASAFGSEAMDGELNNTACVFHQQCSAPLQGSNGQKAVSGK